MLDNIKSSYFFRIIFSFIDENVKLKLVKYNTKLQNKLDINLINYKFFSKKYIIFNILIPSLFSSNKGLCIKFFYIIIFNIIYLSFLIFYINTKSYPAHNIEAF